MSGQSELRARKSSTLLAYGLLIVVGAALFLLIRSLGSSLVAPEPAGELFGSQRESSKFDVLIHVLIALVAIIVGARLLAAVCKRLHQPPVIGEVLAGIILGPSVVGRLLPEVSAALFPPEVAPFLGILAQLGVILFMFLVGLELDTDLLRKKTHATLAISHASIIAPFLLGSMLALWVYPTYSSRDVPFGTFALFMGVSMSVTAFPVLARILTDRGIHQTRMGVIAISCAAVDDVTAWCLLAFVVSAARAKFEGALVTVALTSGYIAVMFIVVRPIVRRLVERFERELALDHAISGAVFICLLLSALATEAIGIHAVFGAFCIGAIVPHDSRLVRELRNRVEDLAVVFLLPAFFAFTGLRTQIGLVSTQSEWLMCGLIVLVASVGKFGGTAIAGRMSGLDWREASAVGILMNTRGLMELIVLNIGLDLRVLSPKLFAMLVIMALVTTMATTPILALLMRTHELEAAEAERA
jgi:Kef-type K+ transport system membrane component KefB